MTFSEALEALKAGRRVARGGWNGRGMWVYLVPGGSYPSQTKVARAAFGDEVPYGAYLALKSVNGLVVPWLASQTDLLSDDWLEV